MVVILEDMGCFGMHDKDNCPYQEKAEKWDEVDKLVNDEGKTWSTIIKENKQLKDNEKALMKRTGILGIENNNLKQKLEKIKELFDYLKSLQSEDISAEDLQEYRILKQILDLQEKE